VKVGALPSSGLTEMATSIRDGGGLSAVQSNHAGYRAIRNSGFPLPPPPPRCRLIGRAAIPRRGFPLRVLEAPRYDSPELPVTAQHLRDGGVSERFANHLRGWQSFVRRFGVRPSGVRLFDGVGDGRRGHGAAPRSSREPTRPSAMALDGTFLD